MNAAEFHDPMAEVSGFRHSEMSLHQVVEERLLKSQLGPSLPRHDRIEGEPVLPPPTGRRQTYKFVLSPTVRQQTCGGCGGGGMVSCPPQVRCQNCGGSGNVQSYDNHHGPVAGGRVFCGSCSGRGSQICSQCGGAGTARCRSCRGSGTLWSCTVLVVRRRRAGVVEAPRHVELPFKMRRSDWEPLVERPQILYPDELRQLDDLDRVPRHDAAVADSITVRTVAVTAVRYRDRNEAPQIAWIVGPHNRVVAPAALARRSSNIRALATGALIGTVIALIGLAVTISILASR